MMGKIGFYEDPDRPGKVIRVLSCQCGADFELIDWFEEQCPKCGRSYNGAGQELAPKSQWGEETGETLADIYSPIDPEEVGHA
jgi:hypothetical protein